MNLPSSEITPESVYLSRRELMKGAGAIALASGIAGCAGQPLEPPPTAPPDALAEAQSDELGAALTPYEAVTSYNNFYEFSTSKEAVRVLSKGFVSRPWTIEVGGLVANPKTYGIEDLLSTFDQEERIYRLRCVEGWSMVIPWLGFPLASLLAKAEPSAAARYVRFEAVLDKEQMPGQGSRFYTWPYVEGLRLDEAMNALTLLSTGLYGKQLLPQNGAPIRLVVPWKYGFKSIKSIVRIDLVEEMPNSLWMDAAPHEYGFFANVNPKVPHPRWSQASERRIGELKRRETLMFNGYGQQVAMLYDGMDLARWY
ncbi:MAG: protein-methionine-sulfoxide reductase catalytic subunit MsrP [Chloroflexi bacterium]|nr:protein-methionine-sulfoxide reductase catalytic subunit MsrP [Chloroflexota bacterium]